VNITLWTLQVGLAALFLVAGLLKATRSIDALETTVGGWVRDVPLPVIRLTGVAEVVGAAGLILPRAVDVAPFLTACAAAGLALTMVGAVVVHLRRGERLDLVKNLVLLALCVALAIGRA
jgi:uncharacterized membrane protein YphA (DoxX/SURF4 family)